MIEEKVIGPHVINRQFLKPIPHLEQAHSLVWTQSSLDWKEGTHISCLTPFPDCCFK